MSGEVKLGEADYIVFWETLLFKWNILCQIFWKEPFDAYSIFKALCCWKMRKTFATNVIFLPVWWNPGLMLINMFNPTFAPNLVTSAWKINPGNPKLITTINGPLCAYWMRQNLHNGIVRDIRTVNVLAAFQNDPWKFTDLRALTVIFRVRSCKMRKEFAKIFVCRIWNNPDSILISIISPAFVQNLATLTWKMSPGMPKQLQEFIMPSIT